MAEPLVPRGDVLSESGDALIPARRLKLDTLVRIRWLAVAGQTLAVLFVQLGLGYPLPLVGCLALIGVSACLNVLLRLRYPTNQRLEPPAAAVLLGYDILQLAGLLYLTGGLANPFAILLIAPVLVSATALPREMTFLLGLVVVAFATGLALDHHPLPWRQGEALEFPLIYVGGVWLAIVCALAFMGFYAARVSEEARQLSTALAATELVLSREQHLSQLDGIAAAVAHELGTPLATISLVVRELERDVPADSTYADDIGLLRSQAERCREILGKLTSLASEFDGHFAAMPVSHLIEDVVAPHREFGIEIAVSLRGDRADEPVGTRNPAILHGLGNLVENAVDFAKSRVEVTAEWDPDSLAVTIADDGPGFAPDVIDRIGEPYVTTRSRMAPATSTGGGLGLGFFIAKTFLERSGAQLSFANRRPPAHGARVTLVWARADIERFGSPPAVRA